MSSHSDSFVSSGSSPSNRSAIVSPAPLLIDLRTAAQMLSVSVCEMRKLTRSKKIRYVKHGKKWLVSPEELRQFVSRELSRRAS
jgi:excisionase family DNA binding protein